MSCCSVDETPSQYHWEQVILDLFSPCCKYYCHWLCEEICSRVRTKQQFPSIVEIKAGLCCFTVVMLFYKKGIKSGSLFSICTDYSLLTAREQQLSLLVLALLGVPVCACACVRRRSFDRLTDQTHTTCCFHTTVLQLYSVQTYKRTNLQYTAAKQKKKKWKSCFAVRSDVIISPNIRHK